MKPLKIIITGGPGFGKSSIITELEKKGFAVMHEKAREVIKQELAIQSNKVPWQDIAGFSSLVVEAICNYSFDANLHFLDRSTIDVEAYLRHGDIAYCKDNFLTISKSMNYSNVVFFTPVWEEIYKQDSERKESFEEASKISSMLRTVYIEQEFTLVDIPKLSVEKRTLFILSELDLQT